jgi:hypothetical protein
MPEKSITIASPQVKQSILVPRVLAFTKESTSSALISQSPNTFEMAEMA